MRTEVPHFISDFCVSPASPFVPISPTPLSNVFHSSQPPGEWKLSPATLPRWMELWWHHVPIDPSPWGQAGRSEGAWARRCLHVRSGGRGGGPSVEGTSSGNAEIDLKSQLARFIRLLWGGTLQPGDLELVHPCRPPCL